MPDIDLRHGDCLDVLRELPDASVDAVVTDPPYLLGFMGRAWDTRAAHEHLDWHRAWCDEAFRVLKPGGHLLAFGGTRTWHRLACAVEDAGFEVRDSIAWMYGSGFPKSLDVSKAIDKHANAAPLWDEIRAHIREWRDRAGMTNPDLNAALGLATNGAGMARHWTSEVGGQHSIPSKAMWQRLKALLGWPDCDLDAAYDAVKDGAERPVVAARRTTDRRGDGTVVGLGHTGNADITAPATDAARTWQGWGTALKPAFEPVVVARKPLAGTVAANVLAHGTGALNVDGCRVEHANEADRKRNDVAEPGMRESRSDFGGGLRVSTNPAGRWPANVVLDESQAAALDEQSGETVTGGGPLRRNTALGVMNDDGWEPQSQEGNRYPGEGGASRFFYIAKADASERVRVDGTAHPTVKPLALMRWLVRLVTPPGGTVLEPFAGSGTTVEACLLEGFNCIAIEREADYLPLIRQRINRRRDPVEAIRGAGEDGGLFDLLGGEPA